MQVIQSFVDLYGTHFEWYGPITSSALAFQNIFLLLTVFRYTKISANAKAALNSVEVIRKRFVPVLYIVAAVEAVAIFMINMSCYQSISQLLAKWLIGSKYGNPFPYLLTFPYTIFLTAALFRASPLKVMDYFAPVFPLAITIYKFGCYCAGCCYGLVCDTIFYNHDKEHYDIPMQLIELACALLIFIAVLIIGRKKHKPGSVYAFFIITFCVTRFASEFLRGDPAGEYGPLNAFHIMCILSFVNGIILLVVSRKYGEKISEFFEKRNEIYVEKVTSAFRDMYDVPDYVLKTRKWKFIKASVEAVKRVWRK